jgi:hypothetical protein
MTIRLVEMLLLSLMVLVSVASPFSNRHIGCYCYSNHRIISSYSIKSTAKIKSRITCGSSCYNSLPHKKQEIAIIGPLLNLNAPPIIGSSIVLDPPTPLQWRTIEASVEAHHSMNADSATANEMQLTITSDRLNLNTMATTDKSPLVAVLHHGAKDYAIIAAIVGIVTKKDVKIDTSDAESFRESIASSTSIYYSDLSLVRLMAVGRGKLSLFNNKYLEDKEDDSPILVARMELLLDSNENGKKPTSPVHALNRLSTYAQRINFLHKDRQRIVRWLQAAQSRLEIAMGTWEDWDNIGSLNNEFKTTTAKLVEEDTKETFLNEFLEEYDYKQKDAHSTPTRSLPLSPNAARCTELDNYGLTTSSAYVDLTSMSKVLLEKLEHFYSPTRLETEDFEYECLSWCALQSLQIYLSPSEIHDALYICTNTCERLEILYHAMIKHKRDLHEIAQAKSTELMNCGEECDLF